MKKQLQNENQVAPPTCGGVPMPEVPPAGSGPGAYECGPGNVWVWIPAALIND